MSTIPVLLAAAVSILEVPLEAVHRDPSAYEGQIIETCGDVYPDRAILYMHGWNRGRSRGGMNLDQRLEGPGSICVRAKVVPAPVFEDEAPGPNVIVSHPDIVPEGWRLHVILPPVIAIPQ